MLLFYNKRISPDSNVNILPSSAAIGSITFISYNKSSASSSYATSCPSVAITLPVPSTTETFISWPTEAVSGIVSLVASEVSTSATLAMLSGIYSSGIKFCSTE